MKDESGGNVERREREKDYIQRLERKKKGAGSCGSIIKVKT